MEDRQLAKLTMFATDAAWLEDWRVKASKVMCHSRQAANRADSWLWDEVRYAMRAKYGDKKLMKIRFNDCLDKQTC